MRSELGQSLVMVLLALPVLLGFTGVVVDGAHAFGEKRRTQNAADAAALAAAQNLFAGGGGPPSRCPAGGAPIPTGAAGVRKAAECYSDINDGSPTLQTCTDRDASGFPIPGAPEDPNCYTWPYKGNSNLVEVKLTRSIDEFFLDAIGLGGLLDTVSARAVAGVTALASPPTTNTTTFPGTTNPGTTQTIADPGTVSVQTVTAPSDPGGAQAFVMSPHCSAIQYNGNPKGAQLSSLATNGGLIYGSMGNKKVVQLLGFNASGCPRPAGEPTGTACSSASNGTSCIRCLRGPPGTPRPTTG
jgi:putative Flp pilus-assembly TadE/G-like protein